MTVKVIHGISRRDGDRATCPVHGTWTFQPGSQDLAAFENDHRDCVQSEPVRRVQPKSRLSPLILSAPLPGPTSNNTDDRSAPGHLGATLGFAPAPRREWRSPGAVRL